MTTEVPPIQVSLLIVQPTAKGSTGRPTLLSPDFSVLRLPSPDVVGDEVAQDRQEVRHRLALASIAALDSAQGDARLRHVVRLPDQVREPTPTQMTGPPQANRRTDRGLDVIIPKRHRSAPHALFNLSLEARRSLTLPPTHRANDTHLPTNAGAGRSPAPAAPTQRLRAPDIERQF